MHLSEEIHEDRDLLDGFFGWLGIQVSGIASQVHFNKNQLQQLLLAVGLLLRDLEFCCFTDTEETPIPSFLANSCMGNQDALVIEATLDKLFKLVDDHVK